MRQVTDEQIINAWNPLGDSPQRVAESLGMAVRNLQERRKRIQHRGKAALLTHDPRRPRYNQAPMTITADRVEVILEIQDGTVLIGNDCHYWPGTVPVMHRAWVDLCQKLKPAAVIVNGDAFDGSGISRFPSIGWEKKPSVREEIEVVRDRLGELFHAAGNARRVWNCGNHDMRFEMSIANKLPEFSGVDGVHLKDHFPEWTPAWFTTINPDTHSHTEIRHREKGGIHAAWNNAVGAGVTIVTGHDHTADVRRVENRRGHHYGVRTGMIADSARDPQFCNYLEGRKPATWTSALAVLTYRGGQLLQPELALRMDDEHYQFRGEIHAC